MGGINYHYLETDTEGGGGETEIFCPKKLINQLEETKYALCDQYGNEVYVKMINIYDSLIRISLLT